MSDKRVGFLHDPIVLDHSPLDRARAYGIEPGVRSEY